MLPTSTWMRPHTEADAIALKIMARACFDPAGGPRYMRRLQHHEVETASVYWLLLCDDGGTCCECVAAHLKSE